MKKFFNRLGDRGWSIATMVELLIAFGIVILVLSIAIYLNKFV